MIRTTGPLRGPPTMKSAIRELQRAVNQIHNATGDNFVNAKASGTGYALSLNVNALLARIPKGKLIGGTFVAKITSSSKDGSNFRWEYSWTEQEKTALGYDGWSDKTGGLSGVKDTTTAAYNTIEDMNGATGTFGNGATSTNLDTADYTFAVQPAPADALVVMYILKFIVSDV